MKPIAKYITLTEINDEIKTASGLILSGEEVSKQRYHQGEVLEVGDEVSVVKSGDRILYDKTNSFTMIINLQMVTIIQFRDVVGVF